MKNFKVAFTLPEVLITLAIVGIVAILVIPTVLNKYQEKILETQAKKVQNELQNAFSLFFGDERVESLYDTSLRVQSLDKDTIEISVGKLFREFLKTKKDCGYTESQTSCRSTMIYTSEDSELEDAFPGIQSYCGRLKSGPVVCVTPYVSGSEIYAYVDLNGDKGPNVVDKDVMFFVVNEDASLKRTYYNGGEYVASLSAEGINSIDIANVLSDILGISFEDALSLASSSVIGTFGKNDCNMVKEALVEVGATVNCVNDSNNVMTAND